MLCFGLLCQMQDKSFAAHLQWTTIYDCLNEGFGTAYLRVANALIQALS